MRFSGRLLWGYGGLLIFSSLLLIVYGKDHSEDDKSKKNPDKASSFSNVMSNSIEYGQDACQVAQCLNMKDELKMLQLEQHRGSEISTSQQPTCNPVFKRFVTNLLKEIEKLGLPMSVTAKKHYDVNVKLSKKMVAEIQKIVNDESCWRTGALDEALSQILINIRLYDKEARKWRFEDTFGVKPDSVIKVSAIVLIIVLIICTEMWSVVSWFVQLKRMFAIWLTITLVWNWFYLYKKSFDEHQADILNRMNVSDTCAGLKEIYWWHNFKEWFQITNMWTLQDDPCKQFYEAVIVNPVLLVSPMKAISMTITTFIAEILKHIGQGISEFLRALLKDLPVTLQIPVLLLIGLSIVIAFAEHQANIVKMETVNDKCTGLKKIDWMDNFKEWFRTALTLQDDPCKQYYEVLIVNPILLVPPTKAITMTITNFYTDPLMHIGQGISEFLRALLKDLPVTLQIPVLLLIGLSVVVFIYSTSQAAVQHTLLRPLRGGRRDPPPGIAQQPAAPPLQEPDDREEEREHYLA